MDGGGWAVVGGRLTVIGGGRRWLAVVGGG